MPRRFARPLIVLAGLAVSWVGAAAAQTSAPQPPAADSAVAELLRRAGVSPTPAMVRGSDAKSRETAIDRLARSYPLPPEMLNLRDRQPDNPDAVMDRLGLRRHQGAPVTNLSTGTPPPVTEIFDALAPR